MTRFLAAILLASALFLPLPSRAQEDSAIDWRGIESTGTLSGVSQGALEKTLWKGQPRSEILTLIGVLPAQSGWVSAQALKKRLLLSPLDAGLVQNDVAPGPESDLLSARLNKLMEMGLYEDALALYAESVEEPYSEHLARLGITLMIYDGDMATACLEEKVYAQRHADIEFWQVLDRACVAKLGAEGADLPSFPESTVLQSVFHDKALALPARDYKTLLELTDLERAVVFHESRVGYDGAAPAGDDLRAIPSSLLPLFLKDPKLPPEWLDPLSVEAVRRGILPASALPAAYQVPRASDQTPDVPEPWAVARERLSGPESARLLMPFLKVIRENDPASLPLKAVKKGIAVLLLANEPIPDAWAAALGSATLENPKNYVYLQLLKTVNPGSHNIEISGDNFRSGLAAMSLNDAEQVIAITNILDKGSEFSDNPIRIYEKQFGLTYGGYYVMPSSGLVKRLRAASEAQTPGVVVLIALAILNDEPATLSPDTLRQALESLLAVGLIEEARLIARETLADLLTKE